ncbi:putative NAD(P)H-dependent D-xylose reductase xyl1 [Xylogone sp. PMI_703]|nr:putative NAD(P)H-dependent D-xylose reductase xyl1 [Xylogone sp. PMI_703]
MSIQMPANNIYLFSVITNMPTATVKLYNGLEMPIIGHGLWKIPRAKTADHVYNAIKAGYRLFDGACDYGNEVEAGQGIVRAIKEGIVKREDLFIVTKLWNTFHENERVEPACRKQLEDWGLEYFDLYVMHFPISLKYVDPAVRYPPEWFHDGKTPTDIQTSNATIQETWQAMETLVDKGLTRAIGLSNFNFQLILDLLRYARIRPATLQIENHPYLVQQDLVEYVQSVGIAVTAYSSFGPTGYIEMDLKTAVQAPPLYKHPIIVEIAERHNKSPFQVLLRWATQRRVAVIPKSDTAEMMAENLAANEFDLPEQEVEQISGLNRGLRFNDPYVVSTSHPCIH